MDTARFLQIALLVVLSCQPGHGIYHIEITVHWKASPGDLLFNFTYNDHTVKSCEVLKFIHLLRCKGSGLICMGLCQKTRIHQLLPIQLTKIDGKKELVSVRLYYREYTFKILPRAAISEELSPGTKINLLSEGKVGPGDVLELTGEDTKFVTVDGSNAQFISVQPVDRDGPNGRQFLDHLTLNIFGNGQTSILQHLNLTVLDVNDNSPTFGRHIWVEQVYENISSTSIITLPCSDRDEAENARMVFSIASPHDTKLFRMYGNKLLAGRLDYEGLDKSTRAHNLTVIAVDQPTSGAARTGTTTVIIKVLPSNEFDPVWSTHFKGGSGATFEMSVPKDTKPGDKLLAVLATDEDEGEDGQIQYGSLETTSANGKPLDFIFNIGKEDGIITIITLLTEPLYKYVISASDKGSPNRTINATITVKVEDRKSGGVNHPPVWILPFSGGDGAFGEVTVVEDLVPGSVVTQIKAEDPDSGPAGRVTYRTGYIVTGEGKDATKSFQLNSTTGMLTLLSSLDLEDEAESYNITLSALDEGNPQLTIHGVLTVKVTDVNEYDPELERPYYDERVDCDLQLGDTIVKLKMKDRDATSQFSLKMTAVDEFIHVKMLDAETGAVVLKKRPRPEKVTTGTFKDIVYFDLFDGGKPERKRRHVLVLTFPQCDASSKQRTAKTPTVNTHTVGVIKEMAADPTTSSMSATSMKYTTSQELTSTTMKSISSSSISSTTTQSAITSGSSLAEDAGVSANDAVTMPGNATSVPAITSSPPWLVPPSRNGSVSVVSSPQGGNFSKNEPEPEPDHVWGKDGGSRFADTGVVDAGTWVVRALCIILFLGYVVLGSLYIAKKYSLLSTTCMRSKAVVHPGQQESRNGNNDNAASGSMVDCGEQHVDAMPDITTALAIASPNCTDSYPREVPCPPVSTATPTILPPIASPSVPLPPIQPVLAEPPPAVPPLSTTSQLPPKFLPPLPEGVRKLPET